MVTRSETEVWTLKKLLLLRVNWIESVGDSLYPRQWRRRRRRPAQGRASRPWRADRRRYPPPWTPSPPWRRLPPEPAPDQQPATRFSILKKKKPTAQRPRGFTGNQLPTCFHGPSGRRIGAAEINPSAAAQTILDGRGELVRKEERWWCGSGVRGWRSRREGGGIAGSWRAVAAGGEGVVAARWQVGVTQRGSGPGF